MDQVDPVLTGRLDLMNIGATGFSLGVATAAEIRSVDECVKCMALLDGFYVFDPYPGLSSKGCQKPLLAMNRTIIDHPDRLWNASGESARLHTLATSNATWLSITNTGDFPFLDFAWPVESSVGRRSGAVAAGVRTTEFFCPPSAPTSGPLPVPPCA